MENGAEKKATTGEILNSSNPNLKTFRKVAV
jgi:hypothetical protein